MNRSYKRELELLDSTYNYALSVEINHLLNFSKSVNNLPLLCVGSGGSLSSARYCTLIHNKTGNISVSYTPLDTISTDIKLENKAVLLITAGGSNKDILSTFEKAISSNAKEIGILCGKKRSRVGKRGLEFQKVHLLEFNLPNGKDGFLAVNSLLAFSVLLFRSYQRFFPNIELPTSLYDLIHQNDTRNSFLEKIKKEIMKMQNCETFIVLYGKWGSVAAYDLESKFTEGGLANIQLADFRNFGHGRHVWIAQKPHKTGIISFITPEDEKLAWKTLNLIPAEIPKINIFTKKEGPIGSIALLVKSFFIVGSFSELHGIDPGRPRVSSFGRKIFKLSIPKKGDYFKKNRISLRARAMNQAINKKCISPISEISKKDTIKFWEKKYQNFLNKINSSLYDAIIFDYDGTLCSTKNRLFRASNQIGKELTKLLEKDITIAIATGRGKSARIELQKIIPNKYWPKIVIGYYNGADIATLNDASQPDKNKKINYSLKQFIKYYDKIKYLKSISNYEVRPHQITIEPKEYIFFKELRNIINEVIQSSKLSKITVVESNHTIDVLAPGVSKLNVFNEVNQMLQDSQKKGAILCVGDKGRWPGNDFFLLNTEHSLSVDTVSSNPDTCWNLAPSGYSETQATLFYLNALYFQEGLKLNLWRT